MTDSKSWYKSKTVWGGLVALAGGLASLFGLETDAASSEAAASALTDMAIAIGSLVAIVGRFQAQRPIA